MLTPDGELMWTAGMADHPDSVAVGDIDGDGAEDIVSGGAGKGGDSTNAYRQGGSLRNENRTTAGTGDQVFRTARAGTRLRARFVCSYPAKALSGFAAIIW